MLRRPSVAPSTTLVCLCIRYMVHWGQLVLFAEPKVAHEISRGLCMFLNPLGINLVVCPGPTNKTLSAAKGQGRFKEVGVPFPLLTWTGFGPQDYKRDCRWHLCKNYAVFWTSKRGNRFGWLWSHEGPSWHCLNLTGFVQLPRPTYTPDFIVSESRVGRIHHHNKFHFGIRHIAVSALLVKKYMCCQL